MSNRRRLRKDRPNVMTDLAARLGITEAEVAERLMSAVEAGFLDAQDDGHGHIAFSPALPNEDPGEREPR